MERSLVKAVLVMLVVTLMLLSLVSETEARVRRRGGHFRLPWAHKRPQKDRGFGRMSRFPEERNWFDSLFSRWNNHRRPFSFGHNGGVGAGFSFGGHQSPWNFDFDFDFNWGRQKNWWEGPNVCRSEETENGTDSESNTITHHFKTSTQVCESSDTAYKCTTKVQSAEGEITKVEMYECCHGFSRKPEEFGCPQELKLEDLPSTARKLGLNDLLRAVSTVDLEEEFARGNFTVFAPVDGTFPLNVGPGISLQRDQPNAVMVSRSQREKMENELEAMVLGHLLPEPRKMSSFSDEDVLMSASPVDSTIRMNFYSRPEKLTTANCVKVTSTDNMASNGVIHVVEEVLPTVTSSLIDLIQRDHQFSYLKTALARANLVSTLQKDGQFTLFAPTNSAFQKMDKGLFDRLMAGDPKCLDKVLKQHLLPNVICSTVIQGRAKSRNLLNNFVNLTRTEDGKLFADNAQVVRTDVMATNGVMHIIDAVLVPDDALDALAVAQINGLTEFVELAEAAGLTSNLLNISDVTVFAPSNEAIQALPEEVMKRLKGDPDLLQSVLTYHVVPEEMQCRQLYNNRQLDTLNAQGKVRVNEYSSFPFGHQRVTTVQCAPIRTRNLPSCNGVIHVIDRVMLPPSGNMIDVLAADSDYSTLVRLLKVAGLADSLQEEGPFTVFAPTNKAFSELGKETMKELEGDRDQLAAMLKMHVFKGHLCCAGIFNGPWWRPQRVSTLNGRSLSLSRDRRGRPLVSSAVIGSCDNTATNGVVHGIQSVIPPRQRNHFSWFPWA